MKKQNILLLLLNDLEKRLQIEEDNFKSCIDDFEQVKEDYIKGFLVVNQKLYLLDFEVDFNSTNETIKKKSLALLEMLSRNFKELVAGNPRLFKHYEQEEDFESACSMYCFIVMLGNIQLFKQELIKIK